jgi:general secretion pathway protein G
MTARSIANKLYTVLRARAARRARAADRRQHGFNLIEIMVVLTIISMLMGAVGFGAFQMLEKARKKETRNIMHSIENALVQWQTESTDACPPSLSDLVTKKILNKDPKDGWGRPFQFKCPGEHNNEVDLISLGKDGKEGTADDIKSWEEDDLNKK